MKEDTARDPAFPIAELGQYGGVSKRELFAAIAMHAEFLSCGSLEGPARELRRAAKAAGQTPVQRMAINAIEVADALLAELAKQS